MIKELRIGNYLKAPLGELSRVKYLGDVKNPNYIGYELINEKGEVNGFGQNGGEPIPLTPEVLLSAGFEIVCNVFCYDNFRLIKKYLNPKNEYKFVLYPFVDFIGGDVEIKYVHQLQNLYFVLTGTELEIDITKL